MFLDIELLQLLGTYLDTLRMSFHIDVGFHSEIRGS